MCALTNLAESMFAKQSKHSKIAQNPAHRFKQYVRLFKKGPSIMSLWESSTLNLVLCLTLTGGQPHTGWSSEISTYRSDQSNSGPGARNYVHTTAWRHGDDGLMFALSQVQQVRIYG